MITAKKMKRKSLLIMLLAVITAAGSMMAYAVTGSGASPGDEDRTGAWDGSVDISWYTQYEHPEEVKDFYIDSPAQLAGLAFIVNGRLDTKQFPLAYKDNTSGTGLYDRKEGKDSSGNDAVFYVLNNDHKGDTDVDISRTVEPVIDGSEDGRNLSGLTAEDFWTEDPVFIQLTGGGGGNTWDQIYIGYQSHDFMGQTVHITADLDMGGSYDEQTDVWSGPNWTPVGGKYPMDAYTADNFTRHDIITIDASFNGALDGEGHTISHLYCDRVTNKGYEYSQGVALVGQFGELYDEEDSEYGHSKTPETALEGWTPTVRDLAIGFREGDGENPSDSYIYGRRMVGGVGGLIGDIPVGVLVENCANFAEIQSTDSKGIGGIVGSGWGRGVGTIRNCYNRGNVTTTYSECPAGGISGANSMNIYNCYNTGNITPGGSGSNARSSGIGRHDSATYTVDNCYSLDGSYKDTSTDRRDAAAGVTYGGYWTGTSTTVIANAYVKKDSYDPAFGPGLKDDEFIGEINGNAGSIFVKDTEGINDGYPVLFWQAPDYSSKKDKECNISVSDDVSSGKVTVSVPHVSSGSVSVQEQVLQPGDSLTVPYGTVVTLDSEAALPMVLENFTARAGDEALPLRADFYVVTDDSVLLGASFIALQQGQIHFGDEDVYHLGIAKDGTALNSFGRAVAVTDYTVRDGDTVFENDQLSYKAVIKKGSSPEDVNKEFSGDFNYVFTYPAGTLPELKSRNNIVRTSQTRHKISRAIGAGSGDDNMNLYLTAEPLTRIKNWTSLADTSWCDTGSISGTYTLTTPEQLAGLAVLVNSGESFARAEIKLGKNISLKNNDGTGAVRYWPGIGNSSSHVFDGSFDGCGHTISGMTAYSSGGTAALFGYCRGAEIRDLTVRGTSHSTGMTAGVVANMNGGMIENCTSYVSVDSESSKAGGIAADVKNKGKIISCRNKGNVKATYTLGGIVGVTDASGVIIKDCANYAVIQGTDKGSSSASGGIAGYLGDKVESSANFGDVNTANRYAGGIAGYTWANTKAKNEVSSEIYDCINWGNVQTSNTSSSSAVGGLVGYAQYLIMDNCYNTGSVSTGYSGEKKHLAAIAGYFYKSKYNDIDHTYFTGGDSVICMDTQNSSLDGIDVSKQGGLDYIKVTRKTASAMKQADFADLLNSQSKGTFAAASGSYPQLKWVTELKEITVTFTGDHNATVRTYYGGTVDLPEAEDGYYYTFRSSDGSSWSGEDLISDVTVEVEKKAAETAYVIYRAGGKEVARSSFRSDECYLREAAPDPETIAHKDGYRASWQIKDMGGRPEDTGNYWNTERTVPLGSKNIVINAVYSQNQLDFDRIEDADGKIRIVSEITADMAAHDDYYFLKPEARGTLTVKEGVHVTVDGSNGPFTNLRIVVKAGAALTLKDVNISADPAALVSPETPAGALQLEGGSTRSDAAAVYLSGHSYVYGTNDGFNFSSNGERDDETIYPAVSVSGYCIIDQSDSEMDSIHITAYKDNPEINILNGATLEIAGGIVEVYRYERLGAQGGMIYGTDYSYDTRSATGDQSGDLTVSGGSLIAVSDTNNVFAFCVNKYTQTGGQVIGIACEAETVTTNSDKGNTGLDRAIFATEMEITGGSLKAMSRTHQDTATEGNEDPIHYYYNGESIRCGGDDGNGLTDNYFLYTVDTSDWDRSREHIITADGDVIYKGKGNNVAYVMDEGDTFIEKRSAADPFIYLWIPKNGGSHVIAVDGNMIDGSASENSLLNTAYTVQISKQEGTVSIGFLDSRFAGCAASAAAYDASDRLLRYRSADIFKGHQDKERSVTFDIEELKDADHIDISIYDSRKTKRPVADTMTLMI